MIDSSQDHSRLSWSALLLALMQGLALFALHRAAQNNVWPASLPPLFAPLWLLLLVLPATLQLFWPYQRERALWRWLALAAVLLALIGWHHAAYVDVGKRQDVFDEDQIFAQLLPLLLAWLIATAFLRAGLESMAQGPTTHGCSCLPGAPSWAWRKSGCSLPRPGFC